MQKHKHLHQILLLFCSFFLYMDGTNTVTSISSLSPQQPPSSDMKNSSSRSRLKCLCICCGTLIGLIVLLVIIIIILFFTLLKPKQPVISIDSAVLRDFSFTLNLFNPSINLTLLSNVSIWNPNHAGFEYSNGTSYLSYRGKEVGEASIPAGQIHAMGTENLTTTLDLHADRIISDSNFLGDVLAGELPLSTTAQVSGTVKILNLIKHHAVSSTSCNMSIVLPAGSLQNITCSSSIKL